MLKTWGLTNFKSIYNTDLELAPLTVLTGTNSSGKSSFIQSMLLIAQTMQNKYKEYPLILNGQYVNFGTFDDVVAFYHDDENGRKSVPVGIRWKCKYESKRAKQKDKIYFSGDNDEKLSAINDLDYEYPVETEIEFNIEYDTNNNKDYSETYKRLMPRLKSVKCVVNTTYEENNADFDDDDIEEIYVYKGNKKLYIEACGPNSLNEYLGQNKHYNIKFSLGTDDEPSFFDNAINAEFFHFFPMKVFFSSPNSDGTIKNRWVLPLGIESEILLKELDDNFLSKFIYIGPLREDPKPLYPHSEFSYMSNFGKKGENTAAILALYSNSIINVPITDLDASGKYKTGKKTLKDAVIEWLNYIGVAEDVKVNVEQGGFTLKVKPHASNLYSDLTNVGVGVSQVVPIVVSCLFANKGTTLIFEQPELHLHPKMQTKLTDFFVAVSQSGRQCIIETHSEHIINALRYRIAIAPSPEDEKLSEDIKIYFATKDNGETKFQPIKINEYAVMSDWPDGFFDESSKTAKYIMNEVIKKVESGESYD